MRKVNRSAIVPYPASTVFDIVDDVASYRDFLPWCTGSEEHNRSADSVEATVELQKGAIRKSFRTRNTRRPHEAIDLALIDGPFRHLSGGWQFSDLGGEGCRLTLKLEFEFDSKLVDMMFGAYFEEVCNSLVDAFSKRAAALGGEH